MYYAYVATNVATHAARKNRAANKAREMNAESRLFGTLVALHFTLLLAILAAIGGLYWQMFDMGQRLAGVEVQINTSDQRLTRIENSLDSIDDRLIQLALPPSDGKPAN